MNTSNRTLVTLGLVLLLLPAASGRTAGEENSSADEKLAALVAEVGPDWEVVEAYREQERAWMAGMLASGAVSKGEASPSAGGASGGSPRVFLVRMSSDGAPSRAEVERALRAGSDSGDGVEVEQRVRDALKELDGAELVDPLADGGDSIPPAALNRAVRAALAARAGDESASPRSGAVSLPGGAAGVAPELPDVRRAAAAAIAILEAGGTHEKTVEAAEFLVESAASLGGGKHALAGARALLEFAPDYGGWGPILLRTHMSSRAGPDMRTAADALFEELAQGAEDPVLRAAGRYYVAAGRMQSLNASETSSEERAAERQAAVELATGLSAGVENELLPGDRRTFAEAEADLIRGILQGTVGSKVPDLAGTRLDGVEERLSDYAGRVVLLDFWATWCAPCVAALPEKRQLVAELSADRFALLSISVDAELQTVTEFLEDEPMPWANWHVGMMSEVAGALHVGAYPTYVLIDEEGEILARTNDLPEDFLALVRETAGG